MDSGEKRNDKLYIPYGLQIEKEYFPGFEKKQLRQTIVGTAITAAIGTVLAILAGEVLILIVLVILGGFGSLMVTIKSGYQGSVLDQINYTIRFKKEQQKFNYVYKYDDF